jgi:hypothetical protein
MSVKIRIMPVGFMALSQVMMPNCILRYILHVLTDIKMIAQTRFFPLHEHDRFSCAMLPM